MMWSFSVILDVFSWKSKRLSSCRNMQSSFSATRSDTDRSMYCIELRAGVEAPIYSRQKIPNVIQTCSASVPISTISAINTGFSYTGCGIAWDLHSKAPLLGRQGTAYSTEKV